MSDRTPLLSAWENIEHAGIPITFRQYDHWASSGFIKFDDQNPRSGRRRHISVDELDRLRIMTELVSEGFIPARATELASEIQISGSAQLGSFRITREDKP